MEEIINEQIQDMLNMLDETGEFSQAKLESLSKIQKLSSKLAYNGKESSDSKRKLKSGLKAYSKQSLFSSMMKKRKILSSYSRRRKKRYHIW